MTARSARALARAGVTRRRARTRQVAGALSRHGLGWAVGRRGLRRVVPFHRGWLGHPRRELPYTPPEHVRLVAEELGATFVKLGQLLSTRADLLPPPYQAELARLQDAAPPEPWPAIEAVLSAEIGAKAAGSLGVIEPVPLAAASIGQAHAGTLADGTEVVVKVRRPGVVELVEVDLELLERAAGALARRWGVAARYDLVGLASQFSDTLRAELDYVREAANAKRFAANFSGDPAVHIPEVFGELSTARVLTLERVRGLKVDDLAGLAAAGIDRQGLARRAARVTLQMVFRDGFFHADPHPGNFFVEPDGRLGIIDFGMVGAIDASTRGKLLAALAAVATGDGDGVVDNLLALGFAGADVERAGLRDDLVRLFRSQLDRPLGEVAIGPLFGRLFALVRRHRLVLPPSLALLFKTIVMSEGLGARLDPSFRLLDALSSFAGPP
ncbi:MAG: ABC1 kinase family protein [Acidimicrobiia bacterium]